VTSRGTAVDTNKSDGVTSPNNFEQLVVFDSGNYTDKTFKYKSGGMTFRSLGTARIKSIDGNVTVSVLLPDNVLLPVRRPRLGR